ncbi:MAG: hypothetical protein HQL76_02020 [Magnetococcales bacterium]|nr:hypothetical protein [Magnetococcales bacterium]
MATYKKFAGAFIRGRLSEARRLAKGETLRIIARQEILIEKGPPPPPIVDSQFMIFAEQFSGKGRKLRLNALHVVQTGGADSLYTPPRLHRQDVTLHEGNEGWRVVRFKDNLEKCCLP